MNGASTHGKAVCMRKAGDVRALDRERWVGVVGNETAVHGLTLGIQLSVWSGLHVHSDP